MRARYFLLLCDASVVFRCVFFDVFCVLFVRDGRGWCLLARGQQVMANG